MATYIPHPQLPRYGDTTANVCVSCSRSECSRGFVEIQGFEVSLYNGATEALTFGLDLFLCAVCLERIICSALEGVPNHARDEREREVVVQEQAAMRAQEELELWRYRTEAVHNLLSGAPA